MSDAVRPSATDTDAAPARFGAPLWSILLALVAGLALGAMLAGPGAGDGALAATAQTVGGLWLDALKVTVIPLVVALLIKGVVGGAAQAREGRLAGRAIGWFAILYFASALIGALVAPALLAAVPIPQAAAEGFRAALGGLDTKAIAQSVPTAADMVRSFVPSNIVHAAAEGQMLPLMIFTLAFALAIASLPAAQRAPVSAFFDGVGAAMLVIIGWVLLAAPIGVFALALLVGLSAGSGVVAAVGHYLGLYCLMGLLSILLCYVIAMLFARLPLARFVRALAPTQAIAFSTQSSMASLPAMLVSARKLGIRETSADVALPLAASLFRMSGPMMNLFVCYYVAQLMGVEISASGIVAGIAVATIATVPAPGLPGQISFISSIAPIALAMGVPVVPLALFMTLENIPDMLRTVGNVSADVAVAGLLDRRGRDEEAPPAA